ncbi:MAG: ATP-dependent DNA helicase [Candidatus Hodarchaeota archaeon]
MPDLMPTINKLFPYKPRDFQEEFMARSSQILDEGQHVVISAPNGFGKTISTLCSAIPVAMENDLKIVYCCRTHTQNARVISELNAINYHLREKGMDDPRYTPYLQGIALRGRGEMCVMDQIRQNNLSPNDASLVCMQLRLSGCKPFKNLKGLSDAQKKKLFEEGGKGWDSGEINTFCDERGICPYFFSMELMKNSKLVVCNYNWMFNPFIQDRLLDAMEASIEDILLIIDEAHNLPSLAENIHSLKLGRYPIEYAPGEVRAYAEKEDTVEISKLLSAIKDVYEKYIRKLGSRDEIKLDANMLIDEIIHHKKYHLNENLADVLRDLDDLGEFIVKEKISTGKKNPRSHCKTLAKFWGSIYHETSGKDSYYHCFSRQNSQHFFEAVCLDPGKAGIKDIMDNIYASVSLSGTIDPWAYSKVCRVPDYETIKVPTPFGKDQVKSLILRGVSTSKSDRNDDMYAKYLDRIVEVARATPSNCAVFCASYKVVAGIKKAGFIEKLRGIKIPVCEKPGMSSRENDELINQFKDYSRSSDAGAVLLGVCKGRNSEGQDFPGNEMNAVMICGIPYAVPTPRVKQKINYYDKYFDRKGWRLGYEIPAIQSSNQAGGRPIRTLNDKGAIIFADERFTKANIQELISPWIKANIKVLEPNESLESELKSFFKK